MKRANVRMRKLRDRARLAVEALAELWVCGKGLGQDLDCNDSIEAAVASPVHLAHAARAKRRDDFIWTEPGAGGEAHQSSCNGSMKQ
jgi:hypothetical protein